MFIACSLKDLQKIFIQSLPLNTSCLFSMSMNDDIVGIEKPDKLFSLTFLLDDISGLFLHLSVFPVKNSRSA